MLLKTLPGVIVAAMIFIIFGVAGFAHDPAGGQVDAGEPTGLLGEAVPLSSLGKEAIGLQVQPVELKPLPGRIAATGRIEAIPTREYDQHAPLSGRITDVLVHLGDEVRAGRTLLMVDSPEINSLAAETLKSRVSLEAEIKDTQAQYESQIKQAAAQVDLWRAAYQRDKRLYEEGIAPLKQLETSLAELTSAESRLEAARRQRHIALQSLRSKLKVTFESLTHRLAQLGVSQEEITTMLRKEEPILAVPVKSARSGVVTEIQSSPGQSIDPGVDLFTVSDLTRVWATADIYQDDMARTSLGQKAVVEVAALPGESFTGTLTFIGKKVDDKTRALPVRVEISNPDYKLKPGMFCQIRIETSEPALAVLVPREAVVQRTGHHIVFLETQGGYQACRVEVGRTFGDYVEVLSGLTAGQKVVVRGAFQLDAQMLKAGRDQELFTHAGPGEEHLDGHGHGHGHAGERGWNPLLVIVALAVAFLGGLVASAVFFRFPGGQAAASAGKVSAAERERRD